MNYYKNFKYNHHIINPLFIKLVFFFCLTIYNYFHIKMDYEKEVKGSQLPQHYRMRFYKNSFPEPDEIVMVRLFIIFRPKLRTLRKMGAMSTCSNTTWKMEWFLWKNTQKRWPGLTNLSRQAKRKFSESWESIRRKGISIFPKSRY